MKERRIFHVLSLSMIGALLAISTISSAADNPDFSGQWTLNESKSDLGEGRFFSAPKMNVKQEGNTITIERIRSGRDGQERTSSETLTMDGKEQVSEGERGNTTTVASWSDDGTTLTIKTKREFSRQGETFEMNTSEVWTLAEGGKVLKIQSESSSSRGERSATLVYDKN
jgi:hypothetical protein